MAVENALQFLRSIEQRRPLPRAFLIFGPQAFLREYVLDAVRARSAREKRQCRSFQIGTGSDFSALLNEIAATDLFAPKKLVVCRVTRAYRDRGGDEAEEPKASKARSPSDEASLAEAVEHLGAGTELVMVYDRDSAPAKLRRVFEKAGAVVNCLRPFDSQLQQYAQIFARTLNVKLSVEAIDALVSRYASDLGAMVNALAKAELLCDKARRVDSATLVEHAATRTPEMFDLAESLARGSAPSTLAIFDRAIGSGRDIFELLAVEVIPALRRMMVAASMLQQGKDGYEIASALGVAPSSNLAIRATDGARRFRANRLERAYRRACELDAKFKMGLVREREAAVSQLLFELMAPEGVSSRSGAAL
jgi:DNA polymerase III delta subunit